MTVTLRSTLIPLLTAASAARRSRRRRGEFNDAFDAPWPDGPDGDTVERLVSLPAPPPAAGRAVELLRRMGALGPQDALRVSLREAIIRDHMRHAWYIATLYRSPGTRGEDDVRLVYRSLATAVDGFDPESGESFLGYAVPVILREVKASRHDDAGNLSAARHARQAADALRLSAGQLTRELGRSPSIPELAVAMGGSREDVVESLDAVLGWAMAGSDLPEPASQGGIGSGERGAHGTQPSREAFAVVFARLEYRAKQVLLMRFLRKMGPPQIAAELGVRLEQVSRLLDQNLGRLGAAQGNPFGDLTDLQLRHGAPAPALTDGSPETTAQPAHSGSDLLAA